MKNLIVVRHAKSSWDLPLKDIERPLIQRGINDARLVATHCIPFLPETFVIWCSTAKRAIETAHIFAKIISYPIETIVYKEELYTFDENQLENVIKSLDDAFENVIIFGHNAAITNFVNKFGNVIINNVPTAGFVALQFETDSWEKLDKGKTLKTIFPKDLK